METKCKYSEWTRGQIEALLNIVGEENARKLISGNVSPKFEKVVEKLFDKNGRRVPKGLHSGVCDADRDFRLEQPRFETDNDYNIGLQRLHECLGIDTGVSPEQFREESVRLWANIQSDYRVAGITNGVGLPVILPKLVTNDLGAELELYLAGVKKGYARIFGDREFYNHCKSELANKVSIAGGSRHDQLIARMKEGPVVGIHFPNPLQGFSNNASCEQMSTLPWGFVLSGLDTPIAMVMHLDNLACGRYTPVLGLAALLRPSVGFSLGFWSSNKGLGFGSLPSLVEARSFQSGGLLFIGS